MKNRKHTPEPWIIDDMGFPHQPTVRPVAADMAYIAKVNAGRLEYQENARRICAAVNACQGIGTEALERGIVAELRHMLGEFVTAAGDLNAAIDGATDQFDAERKRLNAAVHAAQAVLDGGMALDLHELVANRGQIALIWAIEEVQEIRPDLSEEQAWEVLDRVERKHDATLGITWDTLEIVAEDLFGSAPETDSQND